MSLNAKQFKFHVHNFLLRYTCLKMMYNDIVHNLLMETVKN